MSELQRTYTHLKSISTMAFHAHNNKNNNEE